MAKKKKGNTLGFVLVALCLVALILTIVGVFVGQVTMTSTALNKTETTNYKLLDSDVWGVKEFAGEKVGVSNAFGIISFIIALAGLAVLAVDSILHYILGINLKLIRFIGVAASLVGAILVLVAGIVMANQLGDYVGFDIGLVKNEFSAGVGVWLGFIGGLIGTCAGCLGLLKKFN